MRPATTGARTLGNGQTGERTAADGAARPVRALATAARPSVSVVICAYTEDRWQKLSWAIGSIRDQQQAPCEVILVIDHCPPLLERSRREFPGVAVVPNRFQRGLSGGRNTGLAEARGEVVAFMDDDAVASSDWIAVLGGHYGDAQVLGVGGLVEPWWEGGRPPWFPPELDWVVGCSYRGMPTRAAPVRNFIGANMSFRRELLTELRGFAPALGRVGAVPLGCEETELCLRASQLHPDGVLRYDPAAAVRHAVPQRRGRWSYLLSRCYAEGLSKARVAALAGSRRALASERSYLRSALPHRMGRSLADAARGELAALGSVLAILAAVAATGGGYLAGRVLGLARGRAPKPAPAPARPRPARKPARPSALARRSRLVLCLALWAAERPGAAVSRVSRSIAASARDRLAELKSVLVILAAVTVVGAAYLSQGATGLVRDRALPALGAALGRSPRRVRAGLAALASWAGLMLGLALWAAGLAGVAVSRVKSADLGLISVLPVTFWAALGVLALSFCWSVMRQSARWPVLAAHVLAFIAVLNATPAILYGTLRYSWAWKHVGVIDFISHHGVDFSLGGVLGVYQGWPGFFALNSFLTSASGLNSALAYASWAVAVNHLLWLGPFLLIARTFTRDQRLIWTGACLFEIGNWVGQDYFSPQAFTYFLYLTVIAVCLRWLWEPRGPNRWVMVACLVPMLVAIASSHQLTPLMLTGALTVLAVFRQLRPRILPVVMAVITVGWIAYGGRPWLLANRAQLLAGLGNPWANTSAHLVGLAPVPFDQMLVNWGARGASAAMGILAVIGFWRYWQRHDKPARRSWLRVALLAIAAVPIVAANSYGGEIIFRSYLFALPFLAIAAAAAFFPDPSTGRSAATGAALLVTLLAQLAGFSLGNYGDEAMNYFTPREVAASQWLYRTAPAGAQLVGATENFPWAFVHYSRYGYAFLDDPPALDRAALRAPVKTITQIMRPGSSPASYLIFTRSQAEELYLTGAWPAGALPRVTRDLLASGKYRVVYRNADAIILQLAGRGG